MKVDVRLNTGGRLHEEADLRTDCCDHRIRAGEAYYTWNPVGDVSNAYAACTDCLMEELAKEALEAIR